MEKEESDDADRWSAYLYDGSNVLKKISLGFVMNLYGRKWRLDGLINVHSRYHRRC